MEIQHRINFTSEAHVEATLDALGIRYTKTPLFHRYLVHVDIKESHPAWPAVAALAEEKDAGDLYHTEFSPREISEAEWSVLARDFHQGYPQPESSWKKTTYENECPKCGGGYSQKGPFHISKEPRLGKRSFMSLYWTYAVFCTPEVLAGLRASGIVGYEEWPVVLRRTREPSTQVSQLVFPVIAAPGLADESKLEPATCPVCGLTKYGFCQRGQLHLQRASLSTEVDAQVTYEWFGSGRYGGYRAILVSNRLARLILERKWRGVVLQPIKTI